MTIPRTSLFSVAQPMNMYHEALLCWNFHTDADRGKIAYDNVVGGVSTRKMPASKEKRYFLFVERFFVDILGTICDQSG